MPLLRRRAPFFQSRFSAVRGPAASRAFCNPLRGNWVKATADASPGQRGTILAERGVVAEQKAVYAIQDLWSCPNAVPAMVRIPVRRLRMPWAVRPYGSSAWSKPGSSAGRAAAFAPAPRALTRMEILDAAYWRDLLVPDAVRLLTAFVLAFPIAWDREKSTHIMGMRTFSLVALGACAYVLVAEHFLPDDAYDARARVVQGLLAGIGFLGAGAILKQEDRVKGTATAASIWITGALGAAAGHGQYVLAVILSTGAFALLKVLSAVHRRNVGEEAGDRDRSIRGED